jgi:predicted HAD superfamily phosphohydrolase
MEINQGYSNAFRVTLKLKEGNSPHIYIKQLKAFMEDDVSLHPMMNKTLKLLKKTKTPYIMLSTIREVVFDIPNLRHFDRSADPRGAWVCTLWSKDEIKDFKENPEEYLKTVLKFFKALGYELYDSEVCSTNYIDSLQELTSKQIEAQNKGMQNENGY